MNLDERDGDPGKRIAQRNAGMRVGGRVEDDEADAVAARLLNPVDQLALEIALVANHLSARGASGLDQSAIDGLQGLPAIDRSLASSQEIEIGSVKDKDLPVPLGFPDFRHFSQEIAAF
jgi:hypothetical protein